MAHLKIHWPAFQGRYCDYTICGIGGVPESAITRRREEVTCKNCLREIAKEKEKPCPTA